MDVPDCTRCLHHTAVRAIAIDVALHRLAWVSPASDLGPFLCFAKNVSLRLQFSWKETLSFHARRRATLAIPIRHRDNLIAKEGRLYNTEPNLVVYF